MAILQSNTLCKVIFLPLARFAFLFILLTCVCGVLQAQENDNDLVKIGALTLPDSTKIKNDSVPAEIALPDTLLTVSSSIDSLNNDSVKISAGDELKSKIIYNSYDSCVFDLELDKVFMYHNASIKYEDLTLSADYIEIDFNNKMLNAKGLPDSSGKIAGLPVFEQGGEKFSADNVLYNFETKRGKIIEVRTQQGEGYIQGEKVVKTESDNFYIRQGKYTTCDKPHPDFYIDANKLKMVKTKGGSEIITGPAYMVIADVPTPLAIPFGFFPANKGRKSGLIFPAYGESENLGFFLKEGGWYFGISDNIDAALTGDIYSQGSWALHGLTNYANRYHYNGSLGINYSVTKISDKESPDYQKSNDFFIRWNHSQDAKAHPGSVFSASVNAGTSDYYVNNITTGLNYLTNTFQSSISYSKDWGGKYNLSLAARHNQNNITKIFNITLPEIGFGISRITPFKKKIAVGSEKWYEKIGLSLTTNARNEISSPDSLLFKKEAVSRFQNGIINSLPFSTSFSVFRYLTVSPSISFNNKMYFKTFEQRYNPDSQRVFIDTIDGFKTANEYSISASLNTRIYGMANFRKGKIAAIRHVITPSISFSYHPDYGQNKFGYYKTVQVDSLGKTNQYSIFNGTTPQGESYATIYGGPSSGKYGFISFGFDNIVEMKVRQQTDTTTNMKKLKLIEGLSLNSGYNLAVNTFNWSPLSINGRTTILEKLSITGSANFDPYALDSSGIRINEFQYNENGNLFRFTNANVALGFTLNSNTLFKKETPEKTKTKITTSEYYKVPWNLTFSYSYNYSKPNLTALKTQTLYCFGDFSMTEKWKINMSTGWDFVAKGVSYTQLGIVRDLHCWEMRFSWVPFGAQENYYFSINVKSSILQDLKLNKKKDRYDR